MAELIQSWGTLISLMIGGLITWGIRSRIAAKGQRKKDIRTLVDGAINLVEEIQDLAYTYYIKAGSDTDTLESSQKIKSKLKTLGNKITHLHKIVRVRNGTSLLTAHKNLRQSVTLSDFESRTRAARQTDDPIFEDISAKAGRLMEVLEESYKSVK
jgi:hypothetical protein